MGPASGGLPPKALRPPRASRPGGRSCGTASRGTTSSSSTSSWTPARWSGPRRARGGALSGLKRVVTGESFFVTEFTTQGGPGIAAFAGRVPGKISAIDLRGGREWIFQKDAFLCAENAVQMRLGAVFVGGEGLILQRYWGEGTVWIHAPGDLTEFNLGPGETLKISSGHVVGWEASVAYDIQTVGGIKTAFFGGEGLFVTTLTGPGKALLQSMTLGKMALALMPYMPHQSSGGPSLRLGTWGGSGES